MHIKAVWSKTPDSHLFRTLYTSQDMHISRHILKAVLLQDMQPYVFLHIMVVLVTHERPSLPYQLPPRSQRSAQYTICH